jgi:addiction module HigA family antidote
LTGELSDFWSIKVSPNYRIIFRFEAGDIVDPGEILREEYIKELGLTITEVAAGLGVARGNLSAILNERAGISPEMAVKLSEAFGNTTLFWINLQKNYEIWHAEKKVNRQNIKHFSLSLSQTA